MEWVALLLFATVIVILLAGFPVAFTPVSYTQLTLPTTIKPCVCLWWPEE